MSRAAYAIVGDDARTASSRTLKDLISDNLVALSPKPKDAKTIWVMLESPARFHFWWMEGSEDWNGYSAGRVFGTRGELRFWRRGRSTHAVLITDDDTADLRHFEGERALDGYEPCSQQEYLWRGKPREATDVFIETRLPGDLKYPVLQRTVHPRLCAKAYLLNGVPEFVRFCEVVG